MADKRRDAVAEQISRELKFRVSEVGHRKVEFMEFYGSGSDYLSRVRATRPATEQEMLLWDELVSVHLRLENERPGQMGDPKPAMTGVDAHGVRDSLGTPPNMPRLGGFPPE